MRSVFPYISHMYSKFEMLELFSVDPFQLAPVRHVFTPLGVASSYRRNLLNNMIKISQASSERASQIVNKHTSSLAYI